MKKKVIIITSLIIAFLFAFFLFSNYFDSARVRNGIEPKFTIKIVSEGGNKVTYLGLGYKVICYPSVSPNEPYKNYRGVKMGNWFMKYDASDIEPDNEILEIIDKTVLENLTTDQALQPFFEEEKYTYYYPSIRSESVVVKFKDGTEITAAKALQKGLITIKDLDEWKISYIKQEKVK